MRRREKQQKIKRGDREERRHECVEDWKTRKL